MFNEYPYVNLQDVNLDWILKHIKDLETNLQDFVKLNTIKYANPIIWNITTQYETNTVVIDGNTGTAYISVQPVPAGVALTNTDYWTVVFTLNLTTSNQNITFRDDGTNVIATFASDTGDWLLWNFYLYRVTQPISVNTAYLEGFNLERYSVELFIKDYINTLAGIIGDLDDLTTSDKTSIVNAINSLLSDINTTIGDLDDLNTTDKTSVINAINEVSGALNDLISNVGDLDDLPTTDKTSIVNSIIEMHSKMDHKCDIPENYGAVGDGLTDDTTALQACLNANNIMILNGTYLITQITMQTGSKIIGAGTIKTSTRNNIITMNDDCEINGITFTDDLTADSTDGAIIYAREKKNLDVNNCTFATIGNAHCIMFEHCDNIRITQNNISDYGYSGIMLFATCTHADILQNHLYNSRYNAGENSYPICFSGYALEEYGPAKYIRCNYNSIINTFAHWEGIDSHGAYDFEIIGNYIEKCRYGIALGDGPTSISTAYADSNSNAIIKNNYIKVRSDLDNSMTNGIRINRSTGLNAKNIEVDNNFIEVVNTSDVTTGFVSCITVRGSGDYENVKITNNRLYAVACHGINVEGNKVINAQINHNYFEYLTGGSYRYGIRLYDLTSFDNISITNNSIDPTLAASARFYTGPTVAGDSGALIEWKNNIIGQYDIFNTAFDTSPKQNMSAATLAVGAAGQFVPCTLHNTNGGWICDAPGSWKILTATTV